MTEAQAMQTNDTPEATKPKAGATVYEHVTMTDGRTVAFPGKTRMLKESAIKPTHYTDDNGQVVDSVEVTTRFDFRNGEVRYFTIPSTLLTKFAAHGAEQKIGDATAGVQDLDDMVLEIDGLIDQLNGGEWGRAREKGDGLAGASILFKALLEVSGKPAEEIRAFLGALSQKQKVALRSTDKLKPVIERLEAEKAAKASKKEGADAVDTESLLASII